MQTDVFTPLFASVVHPCPLPYARAMPKESREESRLAEENFIRLLCRNFDEPIEVFFIELDAIDEEANQRFLEFFKQELPNDFDKLFATEDKVLKISHKLSKIDDSRGEA